MTDKVKPEWKGVVIRTTPSGAKEHYVCITPNCHEMCSITIGISEDTPKNCPNGG